VPPVDSLTLSFGGTGQPGDRVSCSPGSGHGYRVDQHHPVRCTAAGVVVGHDVQAAAVVAAEHAGEATAVGSDGVQKFAALGHAGTSLAGNAGVPDRPWPGSPSPSRTCRPDRQLVLAASRPRRRRRRARMALGCPSSRSPTSADIRRSVRDSQQFGARPVVVLRTSRSARHGLRHLTNPLRPRPSSVGAL
jgi:hypothetical protein